jgi:hypothetical protein
MRPTVIPHICAIALGVTLAACRDAESPAARSALSVVVDTLGDTIVVRTAGDVPLDAEHTLNEVWRAGTADGHPDSSFSWIHSADITPANHVYVFDAQAPQLRHYDANGGLVRPIGRKGAGPGEYDRANGLVVLTDGRVLLWDGAGNSRLNAYAPDDSFVQQWPAPVTGFSTGNQALTALSDGGWAARGFLRDSTRREALGRVAWFRYSSTGVLTDTIATPSAAETDAVMLIARSENGTSSTPVPFMPRGITTLHRDGYVVWSPGAPYVVHARHGGRPLRIERTYTPVPVSDDERAQRREQVTFDLRRTNSAWTWDGPEIPREKPPVQELLVGQDGSLLVRVSGPSEPYEPEPPRVADGETPRPLVRYRGTSAYELFAPDGTLRARFRLPTGAVIHALRGDAFWGRVSDDEDVPYLVHWRLAPAPTR